MRVVWSIARTTLGEAVRRRVLLVILFIAILFLAIAPGLSVLSARQETTVLKGMTLGILQLTSAVIAIVLTVYMIPNEIERRTIYTILCKPVERWQFVLGKYLGAVMALGLMMALMTGVLIFVFALQQGTGNLNEIGLLAKAPVMYFVQMALLAAVGVFFSTFVSPLVNFFLTGGVYLVGTLFSIFFETLASSTSASAIAKGTAKVVQAILPNFAAYNIQNPIINPTQQIAQETVYYVNITAYGLVYIGILLIAAMIVFQRREV
jgi:ABC-type transport system involved in multi-copper enzyme maturation permease subunit